MLICSRTLLENIVIVFMLRKRFGNVARIPILVHGPKSTTGQHIGRRM
jgi:hypothetical protein